MVPPTESLRFVAGELGKSGRKLEQIGAKFLDPNRFGAFFLNMAERPMGTKSYTKILILPKIFPTRFRFTFYG